MKLFIVIIFLSALHSFCSNRPLGADGKPMPTAEMIAEMESLIKRVATGIIEAKSSTIETGINTIRRKQSELVQLIAAIKSLNKTVKSKNKKLGKDATENAHIELLQAEIKELTSRKSLILQEIKTLDAKNKKLRAQIQELSANASACDS